MIESVLRNRLAAQLTGDQAHMSAERIIRDAPWRLGGRRLDGVNHTLWELLEHVRIAQWDILRFTLDPHHVSPAWPERYWPQRRAPASEAAWNRSVEVFLAELNDVVDLSQDPGTDLFSPIPHAADYNVLREILLVADHNAYHLGQFLLLRQALERSETSTG